MHGTHPLRKIYEGIDIWNTSYIIKAEVRSFGSCIDKSATFNAKTTV